MKRLLIVILLILSIYSIGNSQSTVTRRIISGTSDPATCQPSGSNVFLNTSTDLLKICTATDTWTSLAAVGAAGTVTSVSVTTANGISGSVATATTTPAITLTLGAIVPTSVNSVVISGASTPTLAVTGTTTVSGTNTGDQTTVSGNAGTATALQNPRTIGGVSFNGTANISVLTATGGFTVSGGDLVLGANNITLTGSIAATGARATKLWATDVESTNMYTVGGTSLSSTFANLVSPSFTTPTLGVATATTLNGLTITANGTNTLNIAAGKSLVASNTLTFTGTDSSSIAFGTGGTIGAVGYSATGQIAGTTTNDDAASTKVGEFISSTIGSGSANSLATGTAEDLTSVSLTAGDWDIQCEVVFVPGASTAVSTMLASINTVSATPSFVSGAFYQTAYPGLVIGTSTSVTAGLNRRSLSSTTTIFCVVSSVFTVDTMAAYGILRARRIR